jgi:hypothetical protein
VSGSSERQQDRIEQQPLQGRLVIHKLFVIDKHTYCQSQTHTDLPLEAARCCGGRWVQVTGITAAAAAAAAVILLLLTLRAESWFHELSVPEAVSASHPPPASAAAAIADEASQLWGCCCCCCCQ